jgi:hypothetical protein
MMDFLWLESSSMTPQQNPFQISAVPPAGGGASGRKRPEEAAPTFEPLPYTAKELAAENALAPDFFANSEAMRANERSPNI